MATTLAVSACGGGGGVTVAAGGEIVIELSEFEFSPSEIHVSPGDTVTFVLRNTGDKDHEFMIGRDVRTTDGVPDGFEHNFFEGETPMVMPADAAMSGDMEEMDMSSDTTMGDMASDTTMGEMDMGEEGHDEHGFMVMRSPGTEATLTVTIPADASGEWQIGCFEEDGAHWDDGMRGTLIIDS